MDVDDDDVDDRDDVDDVDGGSAVEDENLEVVGVDRKSVV